MVKNSIYSSNLNKQQNFRLYDESKPLSIVSKIPGSQTYITNSKLSSLQFVDKDITKITRSLNTNKAHGNDYISIRMLKIYILICDLAIIKLLSIIFRNCINHSKFPDFRKKSNICFILKKGDKPIVNNYRPVSLLPICGKILERLLLILCLNILKNTNYYQLINLVFKPMILV